MDFLAALKEALKLSQCLMSHMILVRQLYCQVNDIGKKIPVASLLFVWPVGRSSPKRFAKCCHKENFQGQVNVYITGNF